MKQLVQNYRTGELKLEDVPAPTVQPGTVLVRTANSVISIGTEKLMLEFARKSLIGKALARPDLTRQVIDFARNEGLLRAYRQATSRLDNLTPLGYSSSGTVIEVGEGVEEFRAGDRVACGRGGFASHAEIACVPANLCAALPDSVDFESAAFTTVGAIALHAVRLCELDLGQRVAIIGLGLLGQLALQIAGAAGYRVFGTDSDPKKVELARQLGADEAVVTGHDDIASRAREFSKGLGVDAAIILASASGNEPLETAAEICRLKGKIVAPGMVKLDVPRATFYQKELSLVVSKGWGPGFDDPVFEIKGTDYPPAYVRWTERRNMEAFLEMAGHGNIQVAPLITHRFSIEDAETAYRTISEDKSGRYIGVLLSYGETRPRTTRLQLKEPDATRPSRATVNVGLIGAGAFASGTILPAVRGLAGVNLKGIATATGPSGKHAAKRFGFEYCTTDYMELLRDPEVDCVLIATRHNLHARMTAEAMACGKDVFVEKPLALSIAELESVIAAHESGLMVGFNRRFSPFVQEAKRLLSQTGDPLVINCRVNAGFVPKESWVHDRDEGGGRILGELCHFIDLSQFLTGALPSRVYCESLGSTDAFSGDENVAVTVKFGNGSIANVTYTAAGSKAFPRERVEIFGGGAACVIDNFKSLLFTGNRRRKKMKKLNKDSGHKAEFEAFFSAIREGKPMPVPFEDYVWTTVATICVQKSLSQGKPIDVEAHIPAAICGEPGTSRA